MGRGCPAEIKRRLNAQQRIEATGRMAGDGIMSRFQEALMLSDAVAAIVGGVIGGLLGLAGVWLGYYLSRRGSEKDRRAEKLLTLYREMEMLGNLLIAVQNR